MNIDLSELQSRKSYDKAQRLINNEEIFKDYQLIGYTEKRNSKKDNLSNISYLFCKRM